MAQPLSLGAWVRGEVSLCGLTFERTPTVEAGAVSLD